MNERRVGKRIRALGRPLSGRLLTQRPARGDRGLARRWALREIALQAEAFQVLRKDIPQAHPRRLRPLSTFQPRSILFVGADEGAAKNQGQI
jgi:hypothetical protein